MSQNPDTVSLFDLAARIRSGLSSCFPGRYWVMAEIGELNVNRNGNCYLELIEKEEASDQIRAKIRSIILAHTFRLIKPYFESVTGQSLEAGLKVLVEVTVEYHEIFGLSLHIKDINPAFTLGDLAQARLAVIRRLTGEGIFDMNRSLIPPVVMQNLAVISSETAAGYGDFCKQLDHNVWGYRFYHLLYPAIMQGNEAQSSIIAALDAIYQSRIGFDAVVMVRGGGSQSDLQCFNLYEISAQIAQFPIPVLTGIGHDRDETVTDLVAFRALKTPTAVAEYLIGEANAFEIGIRSMAYAALRYARDLFRKQQQKLDFSSQMLISSLQRNLFLHHSRLASVREKLPGVLQKRFQSELQKIDFLSAKKDLLDPGYTLRRGYSITRFQGKAVKSAETLKKGDRVETCFPNGQVESIVE